MGSILQIDCLSRKDQGHLSCEGSNMNGSAKAKMNLVVYSKPGPPEDRLIVSDINATGCKLSWQATKHTGGLPVDYLVEKYIVSADAWAKQGVTSSTYLKVNDLETGKEYEFRVFAVNEIGESEGLKTNKPMLAKEKYTVSLPPGQPTVTEWTAEAKERVKLDVGIHGEPAPEITWYKGEGEDKVPVESLNDKSIQMMQTDTHAKLIFNNITAAQAGTYTIVARNKSGEDSASGRIKVLDRPAAPEAPIK